MVQSKLNFWFSILCKYSTSAKVKILLAILTPLLVQVPSSLIKIAKVKGVK